MANLASWINKVYVSSVESFYDIRVIKVQAFHPAVSTWFKHAFKTPTAPQREAWPAIKAERNTLIAAPTGSGKTLAAFLAAIDDLVWQSQRSDLFGQLPDETQVVYVSPLKALSNDVHKNLELPLEGICQQLKHQGDADAPIRAMVRTGDTSQSERTLMRRQPPHILVTTPESLYLLLTSDSGRAMLSTVKTLIVDEIHALAGNKRGSHLALSIQRLQALIDKNGHGQQLTRVGLSATQKPIDTVARFLTGADDNNCLIVDSGHARKRDLGIEVTGSPLEAVMPGEVWEEVYQRLADLVEAHRTTLIFVNNRRLTERLARYLGEKLVARGMADDVITSHHGSLSKEHRLDAEQRLKAGKLRVLVATASLELGIDIGEIDLVCQIGSPRGISVFLQRVGRSGHALLATPKGRLFPTTRDELVESTALLASIQAGELDRLSVPEQPLDVLAQQIVAEVSAQEWEEDALYDLTRKAWPYRNLTRESFDQVTKMLAEGFATQRGRRAAFLHRDGINKRLRGRRSARLTALMNGGAIPDLFDYQVVLQPDGAYVGSVNEDFAFESLPGDIFQLGNTAYRILKVEMGKVHVADAAGQPPNIPFWVGEAPGRSNELSQAVASLRKTIGERLDVEERDHVSVWLTREYGIPGQASVQLVDYLAAAKAALTVLPDQDTIIFERFFDEAGDQHLVVHSAFGVRLNRAWGLALRKRFCRKFNFELQAAALEDSIVLSLGSTHSFDLEDVQFYLKAETVRDVLTQALLTVPMFATHWRWVANIALAVRRMRNGKRAPAQIQRMEAEDLMAVVFPDQLACAENLAGEREIPDHPLVKQALQDCLTEVMDVDGLENLLGKLAAGELKVICRDLAGPSPLAHEILTAKPYAFLDDAPAEERRTQMVHARRFSNPEDAAALGRLDLQTIQLVQHEAWPMARDADELHDALMLLGVMTSAELNRSQPNADVVQQLVDQGRIVSVLGAQRWLARERLHEFLALHQTEQDAIELTPIEAIPPRELALLSLVRSRLECHSPTQAPALVELFMVGVPEVESALFALQTEGYAMRGHFSGVAEQEWSERGLLARMHRYTLDTLRREIKPVDITQFMRFLFLWQGLDEDKAQGSEGLQQVLEQLEGFIAPAAAWESELLSARLQTYWPEWLDNLCASGRWHWVRRGVSGKTASTKSSLLKSAAMSVLPRKHARLWQTVLPEDATLSSNALKIVEVLNDQGALFFDELLEFSGLLRSQLETSLAELAANGLATCDSFAGLRALMRPASKRRASARRGRRMQPPGLEEAGRWALIKSTAAEAGTKPLSSERIEKIAWLLLRRYGVVFRKLLERETGLPSWRELLYVLRRLEARGEVRGGRFVDGFSGEQFALPEAVGLLRGQKCRDQDGKIQVVNATDPLNMTGILLPIERVPALVVNRIAFLDGKAIAALFGKELRWLVPKHEPALEWKISELLHKKVIPAGLRPGPAEFRGRLS